MNVEAVNVALEVQSSCSSSRAYALAAVTAWQERQGLNSTNHYTDACAAEERSSLAEITGDADAFLLPDGAVTVQPGARLTMDVSFLATGYEPVEAQVRFTTNDAAMPELIVTLAGTAATDQDADGYDAVDVRNVGW